jgi:PAT family beta-lactamase induction signal transducer AmpG
MFTLCVLYCAQGIPWGFITVTLVAYVSARKVDTAVVGSVIAMTTLPYSFKWVWGPLIDAFPIRRFGHRRPWIIFAQLGMAVTCGVMILIPDLVADIHTLMWAVFVHTIFNSMQDVAVDGLAVDLLDEKERGRANGLMYGAKYGGGALGGWGLSHVMGFGGIRLALIFQFAAMVAIMMVPVFVRERSGETPRTPLWPAIQAWLRSVFGGKSISDILGLSVHDRAVRSALIGGMLMLTVNLAIGMMSAVAPVLFTQDLKWDAEEYANLIGGPGLLLGLGGSVLGGFLADLVGHRLLAAIAAITLGVFWLIWAALVPHWGSHTLVYSLVAVEPLCASVMTVSLFALCMDISWKNVAASQFAAYMALINFSSTIGAKYLAPFATETWTYPGIYCVAAAIQLGALVFMPFIDPRALRTRDPQTH